MHTSNAVTKWISVTLPFFIYSPALSWKWTLVCRNFILSITFSMVAILPSLSTLLACDRLLFVASFFFTNGCWTQNATIRTLLPLNEINFLSALVYSLWLAHSHVFLFNFQVIISFELKYKHYSRQMWYVYTHIERDYSRADSSAACIWDKGI